MQRYNYFLNQEKKTKNNLLPFHATRMISSVILNSPCLMLRTTRHKYALWIVEMTKRNYAKQPNEIAPNSQMKLRQTAKWNALTKGKNIK